MPKRYSKTAKLKDVSTEKEPKIPIRKHLKAMDETALVELILQLAKKYGSVRADLEERFSTADQKLIKLKTAISRFRPTPSYYGDSETDEEVSELISGIRKTVVDPKTAMDLLVRIFEKDREVMESANEYEYTIGDVFLYDATKFFGELARKIDDKKYVEDILLQLIPYDEYGTRDDLIKDIRRFLPLANIKNLATRLIDSPCKKTGNYGCSSTRTLIRRLLGTVGEPAFFEEILLAFDGSETPEMCVDVAKAWFGAKSFIKAQEWLDKIPDENMCRRRERLEMLKVIQAKRKDKSGLADTARELLKTNRTKENFDALIKAVGEKRREDELAEQCKMIEQSKTISYCDVEFMTSVGATDAAEEYIWRRLSKLTMWGREPFNLAKLMESKKRPLIATILYRKLIESILASGKSKNYAAAISYMGILTKLAPTITDWKSFDSHKTFIEKLREKFPNRPSFWPKIK